MGKNKTKKPEGAAEPVTEEAMFLQRAHELKDKGNTHFANRQHVQALACYAQALRVAPEGHPDRALFHSNRAACYLRDGLYAEVIHECNEALGVNPKFGKALLRRAKAFELKGDVNRALSDCRELTQFEPASEEAKAEIARLEGLLKNTTKKQRAKQRAQLVAQTQAAALQNMSNAQNLQKRPVQPLTLKINMGSDTRLVQVAGTLPFAELMSTIRRKFPEETGHLQLKYKDRDNQLITITNRQDLLAAVATQVRAWQVAQQAQAAKAGPAGLGGGLGKPPQAPPSVQLELCRVEAEGEEVVEFDDWLLDFAELFREHLGIDADGHVDLHNEGLEKCNLALEAAVGSEAAVPLFEQAAAKFQEVAALALLNWGNVHMCQARRLFDSNGTGDDKDKEKKEEKVTKKGTPPPPKPVDPKEKNRNELKAAVLLSLQSVQAKDYKAFHRVIRLGNSVHKTITPGLLLDGILKYYPEMASHMDEDVAAIKAEREEDAKKAAEQKAEEEAAAAAQKAKDAKAAEEAKDDEETVQQKKEKAKIAKEAAEAAAKEAAKKEARGKEEAKKEEEAKEIPEVKALMHLLLTKYLVQKERKEKAAQCATALVAFINTFNRRSLDLLSACAYHYYSLTHENLNKLDQIRSSLITFQRTACLQHNDPGQAALVVALLRNFLHYKLYTQADLFRLNTSFPENRSNNIYARYLFYIGHINAVQLQYSDAFANLTQAVRKAPQNNALGFRQAATKLLVIVQLLMGDIPERSVFRQVGLQASLLPYFKLTQAVRVGDLVAFEKVVSECNESWARDNTISLITRLRNNVIKTGLRKISMSYSRISLEDVRARLNLPSVEDAEFIISKCIFDGVIDAVLDRENRFMYSKDNSDRYASFEPGGVFHKRVMFCMDIHNGAVKAMRYPGDTHKTDVEEALEVDEDVALEADSMDDD